MSEIRDYDRCFAVGNQLADLCRTHEIGPEWIEGSRNLDDLLAHVLDECDRRLGELPQAVFESNLDSKGPADQDDRLGRLQTLLAFVRRAGELRDLAEPAPTLISGVAGLEQIRNGDLPGARRDNGHQLDRAVELMGEVASLCHKINNPLTSLLGRAQMLQLKSDPEPADLARAVVVIEDSARRVAALVQELGHLVCHGKEELLRK